MEQQFDNQNEIKQNISSQQQTEIEKDEKTNQQLTNNQTTNLDTNLQNDKNWGRSLIKSITITCVDSVTKKPIDGGHEHDRKYLKLWKMLMSNNDNKK